MPSCSVICADGQCAQTPVRRTDADRPSTEMSSIPPPSARRKVRSRSTTASIRSLSMVMAIGDGNPDATAGIPETFTKYRRRRAGVRINPQQLREKTDARQSAVLNRVRTQRMSASEASGTAVAVKNSLLLCETDVFLSQEKSNACEDDRHCHAGCSACGVDHGVRQQEERPR